ncbi:MAG: hypothetical protein ACTHVE_09750 [Senegalia sp. (in: firmicutes)]|uniref:hypothetical protein n=1 Tax=Senegalia sp. (in: firmicutes) TaxID=1924098 RepID=UPI003F9665E1
MKNVVQSLDRALSIIKVLSDYYDGLGITETSTKGDLHNLEKVILHHIIVGQI